MKSRFKKGDKVRCLATDNIYIVQEVHINPVAFSQPKIYLKQRGTERIYNFEDELEFYTDNRVKENLMKEYKMVHSEEIEFKIERLGIKNNGGRGNFVIVSVDSQYGLLAYYCSHAYYVESEYQEITQKDFLALPEPIVKGDWVFMSAKGVDRKQLVKIDVYTGNTMRDTDGLEYAPSDLDITKLTQQQLDILELS